MSTQGRPHGETRVPNHPSSFAAPASAARDDTGGASSDRSCAPRRVCASWPPESHRMPQSRSIRRPQVRHKTRRYRSRCPHCHVPLYTRVTWPSGQPSITSARWPRFRHAPQQTWPPGKRPENQRNRPCETLRLPRLPRWPTWPSGNCVPAMRIRRAPTLPGGRQTIHKTIASYPAIRGWASRLLLSFSQ